MAYKLLADSFEAQQMTAAVLANVSGNAAAWVNSLVTTQQPVLGANKILEVTHDSIYDVYMNDDVHRIVADDWITKDPDGNLDCFTNAEFVALFGPYKAVHQTNLAAASYADVNTGFNALLTALENAGIIATS